MKKCKHCNKTGFQAERFFAIRKNPKHSICLECAVDVYLMIRNLHKSGKTATTGKLDPKEVEW